MGREGKIFVETIHEGNEASSGQGLASQAPSNHVSAELDVTTKGGTNPTLDVILQESVAGIRWFDLISFAQATGVTAELKKAANPARHFRVKWTIGGTAGPNFTFTVKLIRDLLPAI